VSDGPARALTAGERSNRAIGAALLAVFLGLAVVLPISRPLPFDVCVFKRATGLPCPACGLTRSLCAIAKGEWRASLALHPVGWLVAVGAAVGAAWMTAEARTGEELRPRLRRRLAIGFTIVVGALAGVFWIASLASRFR
jgi:hypothetical protein